MNAIDYAGILEVLVTVTSPGRAPESLCHVPGTGAVLRRRRKAGSGSTLRRLAGWERARWLRRVQERFEAGEATVITPISADSNAPEPQGEVFRRWAL